MTKFFNKMAASLAGGVVILFGLAMAGLGLMVMAGLSVFALAVLGLALLAAPFVALLNRAQAKVQGHDAAPADPAPASGGPATDAEAQAQAHPQAQPA